MTWDTRGRMATLTSWGARSYVWIETVTRSHAASDHSSRAIWGAERKVRSGIKNGTDKATP